MVSFSEKPPVPADFFLLFDTTGWNSHYHLNESELFNALKNSWYHLSAYDDDRLIGFGRIICDGVVHALILDMIVHPDYQGEGVGTELLDKLVAHCREYRIRDIQLFCAKGKKDFYLKGGFSVRPSDGPGMEIKMQYK